MNYSAAPTMVPPPTCIDCKHALELAEEPGMVACTAHLEYFPADHPATCADFIYHPHHHCGCQQEH